MDQLNKICVERGLSLRQIGQAVGLSTGTFTGWSRGAKPNNANLKKIADHFGVTVDWLLSDDPLPGTWQGQEHSDMPLTPHEKLLLDTWRSVDKLGQEHLLRAFMAAYNDEILRMRGISFEDDR